MIRTSAPNNGVYYQNTGLSVSNRITVQSASLLFNNITLSVSGNVGRSTSLLNQFVNPGVLPVTGVTEEGVSEGSYHPSSYRTERQILGEPVSMNGRIQFNRAFVTGGWKHAVSYGVNGSFRCQLRRRAGLLIPTDPFVLAGLPSQSDRFPTVNSVRSRCRAVPTWKTRYPAKSPVATW